MGFIDSKIQKYSIDEVADDLVEKVTEEPRYVIEQSLEGIQEQSILVIIKIETFL